LILLHGYPQNHHCWEHVAPTLAQEFDVIIPDLRGYGDSDAPADDAAHTTYAKRQMAADIVALMDTLGLKAAHILGHDRGGRVAYRFALDHPDRLLKLGIIEIVPTGDFWANWLHAMCADYRAGATTDRAIDDTETGTINAPLHFLWAEGGFPAQTGDPAAQWRKWAPDLTHESCISGHFAMEENPDAVLNAFLPHFRD